MLEQENDTRMLQIVEIGQLLIATVCRQRILQQVVGSYRDKIKVASQLIERQRGCRDLDHATQLQIRVIALIAFIQFFLCLCEQFMDSLNFLHIGDHRDQATYRPGRAGAQNGAQLGFEQFGVTQTKTDGAQAQCRVGGPPELRKIQRIGGFVRSQIQGPDGQGFSVQHVYC